VTQIYVLCMYIVKWVGLVGWALGTNGMVRSDVGGGGSGGGWWCG